MKRKQLTVTITLVLWVFIAGYTQAEWITLDYPGSSWTAAYGIDGSNIVGAYRLPGEQDQDPEKSHGFLYDGTSWITLDYPDSRSTCALGVDGSNIVGAYFNWGDSWAEWPLHTFLYDGTAWTTLPIRGWAYKIDGGIIAGTYQGWGWIGGYYNRGFLLRPPYDTTSVTTIHYPGAHNTNVYGIDGSNIVGVYYIWDLSFPFLYDGTNWTALADICPLDIDGNRIVGTIGMSSVLIDGTSRISLVYPGNSWTTVAYGIDGDRIVGYYGDESGVHGFLYQPDVIIPATIELSPDTINLRSKVKWMTCYIELSEGYDVDDIDVSTIKLNGEVSAESEPIAIGDYDSDGITDLMVKFNMSAVQGLLQVGEVELTVTGELTNGTLFEGSDTIRVINPGG